MIALCLAALAATSEGQTDARLLVGVLDYVAADYGGAVRDGRVLSDFEYREQLSFVKEARAMAERVPGLPPATTADLAAIEGAVLARAPAAEVTRRCRSLRDEVVARLRLIIAPATAPPPELGARLYATHCVACHGADGRAGTPRARELSPPPRDFHDPEVLAGLSPYRAFGAISFGVNGTAMAAFPTLSEEERWSMAFHVFRFAHARRAAAGRLALRRAGVDAPALGEITLRSDAELRAALGRSGMAAGAAADALSYLRVLGYRESRDPLDEARQKAALAVKEHAARRFDPASRIALEAYLSFEGAEGRLRARDADLVAAAERAFMDLREAMRADVPASEVGLRAARVDRLLGEAQAVLTRGAPHGRLAFLASLVIFLREGVEAALLVGLLLGVLVRSGRRTMRRFVHLGWGGALLAGGVTFWAASRLIRAQSVNQEVLEGIVSLLAAGVLFYVSYWTLSQASSQRWLGYLRGQVEGESGRSAALLFGLAFLAVYREAVETVLFYQALLLERGADRLAILLGAGAGAALAALVVVLLRRVGSRLPVTAFFNASGALLCLLAVVFAGAGLHELRQGGWMRPRPLGLPSIEWLGLYADLVGLLVQGAMLLTVAAGLAAMTRQRRTSKSPLPG